MTPWASVLVLTLGCVPCQPIDRSRPQDVCRSSDAGPITAGQPFVLMASTTLSDASCAVSVNGGQIDLSIGGSDYCGGSGLAKPLVPQPVPCAIPALPEGAYVVNSLTPLSFTLPDAGIPSCPL